MDLNVSREVIVLRQMTARQLREKYREVFGHETRSRHKAFLIKRIVWRLQALAEGDLSERARRRAEGTSPRCRVRQGRGLNYRGLRAFAAFAGPR